MNVLEKAQVADQPHQQSLQTGFFVAASIPEIAGSPEGERDLNKKIKAWRAEKRSLTG